jgi:hypothetical protein
MKVGCTGTRNALNQVQLDKIKLVLARIADHSTKPLELHHGDCVGADAQIAEIAKLCGFKLVVHPPVKSDLRAFHQGEESRPPLSYFARNRNIVNETEILIVAPKDDQWQPQGGTWYTHDYAVKQKKPVIIFYPRGVVSCPAIDSPPV